MRQGYSDEVETLFKNYVAFTPRVVTSGPRSNFLGAVSKSPYVDIDKKISTNDVKYLIFTDKFKNLLDKCVKATNGESVLQPNSFNVPSTSAMSDLAQAYALETAPTVPDVDMEENRFFNSPSPFYPENGNLRTANVQEERNAGYVGIPVPQDKPRPNADADSEPPAHTLPLEELSFPLNFPANYDPALELTQSLGRNLSAIDNSLMGGPPFEIRDVCGVELKGNMVCKIQDIEPNATPSQMRFLFTIQKRSSY